MQHTRNHKLVALGGTFDRFHKGHEKFLKFAFEQGQKLIIGVTDPRLTASKLHAELIEPLSVRKRSVSQFCTKHTIPYELITISDLFGPTLTDRRIDALCVTEETVAGGEKINHTREAMNLRALPTYICGMFTDETGEALHSEAIRAGKVSRQGVVYARHFQSDLTLSQDQRAALRKPLGKLVQEINADQLAHAHQHLCLVGDTTLHSFIQNELPYTLAVYDGKEQRQPASFSIPEADLTAQNPAGTITQDLINKLQQVINKKSTNHSKQEFIQNQQHLFIQGEEDLATIALVMLLPLEAIVVYGQPNEGIVLTTVSEKLKQRIFELLFSKA